MIRHVKRVAAVLLRVGSGTSGNVLGAPGGQHGSYGKFKTAVLIRDNAGWLVLVENNILIA
ncbi:hypothetical protein DPMN_175510 [Dreissena polymorpha]|uniref:Uncharacterized protein n=1 Tax=Dreissena polymorpha TaxID=45954 RepID=A0A9D4E6M8_DREPO|nr:hypothetical protein DPMN_175510 [Dreissena polymorpha]